MMLEPKFIHLHVHSDYSIVKGLAKNTLLVKKTAELGMPAIAITDCTNLYGLIKFYNSAYKYGIKPIIGATFLICNPCIKNYLCSMTILAINNIGYKNLILLISKAHKNGYNLKGPIIYQNWLIEMQKGLLLISGGRFGDIGYSLLRKDKILISKCLNFYQKFFPDRFYLELIRTGRTDEERYLIEAIELSQKYNIPVVATNDVCFIHPEDFAAHDIRVCIHDGTNINQKKSIYSSEQYLKNEKEMCALFSDIPEALKNSVEIAKRCNVLIDSGRYFLPNFPSGCISSSDFLIKKTKKGLEERLLFLFPNIEIRQKKRIFYDKRLNHELNVINQMGFPGYFLIVMEFIQWAKNNKIPVGPGRGSGAGSLVAYALKITDVDPIKFDLLFERFLNPERISMPDFDIDFCMEKRDYVIEHVSEIYGRESVSQIITFGTLTAKAVIRDVGRALGYTYGFVDKIAKLIPSDFGITLNQALNIESKLKSLFDTDQEIKTLINMALKLEGVIRNVGKHAGGVVISPTKITDFVPIYCDMYGNFPVTQFDKNDVEYTGLVKFDFLGLRTLTIIDRTLKMINQYKKSININSIPLDDKKSFKKLQNSETKAIFQLESRGMKELINRLRPDCFEDIIALVALFRPGPLQSGMVDNFINRKHGKEKIFYPDVKWQHKILKPILKSTYGIILYQEQVMKIAQIFAGYTLGKADILRRAMGKKDPIEMSKQRSIFESGAKNLGINGELAVKIFNLVEKFSGYGFNKSHSTAYALISYQTLWLKTHYPAEFMAAVMSSDIDNTEKINSLIHECRHMGLKILFPNINLSLFHFHVTKNDEIIYGLGAIKGIGFNIVQSIINIRNKTGPFVDLFDFCIRHGSKKITKRILEKFILSGTFDVFGKKRETMIHNIENALKISTQYKQSTFSGQSDLFDILTDVPKKINNAAEKIIPWSEKMLLKGEKETLGLYLTENPIDKFLKKTVHHNHILKIKNLCEKFINKFITVAGFVTTIRCIKTKKDHNFSNFILDDYFENIDVFVHKNILNKYQSLLKNDNILIVSGQLVFDSFDKKLKINAHSFIHIND